MEWERALLENPTSATYLGDHRYDDRWADLAPAALERSHRDDLAALAVLDLNVAAWQPQVKAGK